jgi:hypothetical protein
MLSTSYQYYTKPNSKCTCKLCLKAAIIRQFYYEQCFQYNLLNSTDQEEDSSRVIYELLYCLKTTPYWLSHLNQWPESFTIICNGKLYTCILRAINNP